MLDNRVSVFTPLQMNKLDELKLLRLQEELKYVDTELVEQLASTILDGLVVWSNTHIFSKLNGELTIEIPLGPPNAGVGYKSYEPPRPHMVIYLAMITDIYRDALTYPVVCKRLAEETDTLDAFHEVATWEGFPFAFKTAMPMLRPGHVHGDLSFFCEVLAKQHELRTESVFDANDVRCRFVMFELMLVWTFFHELGHVVQQHYRLRNKTNYLDTAEQFLEFPADTPRTDLANDGSSGEVPADLPAQARELMADAESMDLTLKYIHATGRLCFPLVYLLHCSVSCMFQRFYQNYSESLNIVGRRHPHPALREQVSEAFLADTMSDYLVVTKQVPSHAAAAVTVTYATVRANLLTGLFRAHRVEQRVEVEGLPSYMRLQTDEHRQGMLSYQNTLMPYIESQMTEVRQWHLVPENRMDNWLEMLRRHQSQRAQTTEGP